MGSQLDLVGASVLLPVVHRGEHGPAVTTIIDGDNGIGETVADT